MTRPSWDEYFMSIAEQVAGRSTCLRRHTGAILVKERRILATGYNGTPAGLRHCEEVGCIRDERKIASGSPRAVSRYPRRAERRHPGGQARHRHRRGDRVHHTSAVRALRKILINAGVVEIVFRDPYPDPLAEEILAEAGVVPRPMAGTGER
jgi:dCMP deaminase